MAKHAESKFSRLMFNATLAGTVCAMAFGFGLYSAQSKNSTYRFVHGVFSDINLVLSEAQNILPGGEPVHFLQPARQPGSGVTINNTRNDGKLVMISGFFEDGNQIRLIERDGTIVQKWPLSYFDHFTDTSFLRYAPKTERNVDTHGALLEPDGSVVFNYEYAGSVKLDRCGNLMWTIDETTHHSIEKSERGGYWVAGRDYIEGSDPKAYPPFTRMSAKKTYHIDTIMRVDENGKLVTRKSVPGILFENGLEPLLTANGINFRRDAVWDYELVHINKIAELPAAIAGEFEKFEAGDLAISMRKYNLIFVVDPDDWKVKWYQTGPWRRQHDPEFNPDGTISVFNNNVYWLELDENDVSSASIPRDSNIMKADPDTGKTNVVYGGTPQTEFVSVIRGKHDPNGSGGFLVTEFEAGRLFEFDSNGTVIWEYINRYDETRVAEISEARLYDRGYFKIDDWSCDAGAVSGVKKDPQIAVRSE